MSETGFTGVYEASLNASTRLKLGLEGGGCKWFFAEPKLHDKKVHLGYFPTASLAAVGRARALRGAQQGDSHFPLPRSSQPPRLLDGSSDAPYERIRRDWIGELSQWSLRSRELSTKPRLKGGALLQAWASRFQNESSSAKALSRRTAFVAVSAEVKVAVLPSSSVATASKRPKLMPTAKAAVPHCVPGRVPVGAAYQARLPACDSKQSSGRAADLHLSTTDIEVFGARATAALLTSAAYGPMNAWSFISPSDCGLGLFARVALQTDQVIGEYGGPRLPSRLHVNGGQYVLQVPDANEIIDGAFENSPFDDGPRSPVIFANHSHESPNARLLYMHMSSVRSEVCELRGRMWIVAKEFIPAGGEIRIDYESGESSSYWLHGRPVETRLWRTNVVQPPPPTTDEPLFVSSMNLEAAQEAAAVVPLPWEGEGGGDARLEKLIPQLVPAGWRDKPCRHWGLVATHFPGRMGRECFDRWLVLHGQDVAMPMATS